MAMNLARRDILGDRMNRLQLFFVPVSLNAYAVFRVSKQALVHACLFVSFMCLAASVCQPQLGRLWFDRATGLAFVGAAGAVCSILHVSLCCFARTAVRPFFAPACVHAGVRAPVILVKSCIHGTHRVLLSRVGTVS